MTAIEAVNRGYLVMMEEDARAIGADAELVVVGIDCIVSDDANLIEAETGNSTNAVTGVSSDPASVTVKALVTPSTLDVSAVYNKLIIWGGSRGSVGITPDRYSLPRDYPARLPVSARIGASSDSLDVWAVQVNVRVGGLTEEQEELDANAVSVSVNSDDNNQSGIQDVYESNDVLGLGVTGEDDLVPVSIGIEPSGVPVGELALVLPAGDHFAACANDDKSGGRLNPASWSLDAGQPPYGIALEGVSLTGPQSLSLQYSLGSTMVTEDSAKVKCVAHPDAYSGGEWHPAFEGGVSPGSFLRMYATRSIGGGGGEAGAQSVGSRSAGAQSVSAMSQPIAPVFRGQAVGGMVMETLVVNIPAHCYVMGDGANIQFTRDFDPENIKVTVPVHFNGTVWYRYDSHRTPDEWDFFVDENGKTNIGRPYSEPGSYTPRDYGVTLASPLMSLFTTSMPIPPNLPFNTVNDPHSVSLHSVFWDWNPEGGYYYESEERSLLPIIGPPDGFYENGPVPSPYSPRNIMIQPGSIQTNATEDYLKYDPDSDDQELREPSMSFRVIDADAGSGHQYNFCIFVQPTGAAGFDKLGLSSTRWVHGVFNFDGGTETTVNVPGEKMLQSSAFSEGWGTYTFDVGVFESDGDWFYYKWPYCLSIGDHTTIVTLKGNGVNNTLSYSYTVIDYAYSHTYPNFQDPSNMKLLVIDNTLSGISSIDLDAHVDNKTYNGIAFTSNEIDDLFLAWRTLYIGEDSCWIRYRRDSRNSRMLAENITYTQVSRYDDDLSKCEARSVKNKPIHPNLLNANKVQEAINQDFRFITL